MISSSQIRQLVYLVAFISTHTHTKKKIKYDAKKIDLKFTTIDFELIFENRMVS